MESRWREDCVKSESFYLSATAHSQEASASMRKSCTLRVRTGTGGKLERGDVKTPGSFDAVSTKTAAALWKEF